MKFLNPMAVSAIGNVLEMIDRDYSNKLTLDDLCRKTDFTRTYFEFLFKQATNLSPMRYLLDIRVKKAIDLLMETNLTITEIAYRVGFSDSNYFIRQFHKAVGKTPLQYRKEYK